MAISKLASDLAPFYSRAWLLENRGGSQELLLLIQFDVVASVHIFESEHYHGRR
jgi:hypothetical protein